MIYARFEAKFKHGRDVAYGVAAAGRVRWLVGDIFGAHEVTDDTSWAIEDVSLLVPTEPSKVLAVGLNYRSHLGDRPTPAVPEIFLKPPSCLVANGADIVLPKETDNVHYEGEMVVVIGKPARNVAPEHALAHVFGVTCGNDVSARDWQKNDLQWWRAKGTDTFGPCGPFIVSGLDYDNLGLQLRVNGEVKQEQRTSDLIHNVAQVVSWVSRFMTLEPGDLIYTGTPGKTTALKAGDVVEVELEGVGILKNRVVSTT